MAVIQGKCTSVNESFASSTSRIECRREQFTFTWSIENFSMFPKPIFQQQFAQDSIGSMDTFDTVKSSSFTPGKNLGRKESFELIMCPYKVVGEVEYVSIHLQKIGNSIPQIIAPLRVYFTISVIGAGDELSYSHSGDFNVQLQCCGGWDDFILRSELTDQNNHLLPDDKLTVLCKMTMEIYEIHVQSDVKKEDSLKAASCDVSNIALNLNALYESQNFSDVILQVGKEEIKAHKAILSARSPVFESMFQLDTEEENQNRIEITDIEVPVLRELLRYIYCGEIAYPSQKICLGLYAAANKYFIPQLMQKCSDYLISNLDEECVCDRAALAYLFDDKKLLTGVKRYIVANSLKVMATRAWIKLASENPDLANDIVKFAVEPKIESVEYLRDIWY